MIYYSPERLGFFHARIHAGKIPPDAVEISDKEHRRLLDAQANGQQIVPGRNGRPMAVDRPEPVIGYDRSRRYAYGPIGDMLDMIYRDLKAGGAEGEFTAHIEAVKSAHPKPA